MSAARLTTRPIDTGALIRAVEGPDHGAVSIFLGTVRNSNDGRDVDGIDYSAYDAMADAEMNRIVAEAVDRFPGIAVALEHRIGTLRIGDVSVAIACAKPFPRSPSKASAGRRIASNRRVASGCGAITRMRSLSFNPLVEESTMKADRPFAPAASPVRASRT